MLIDYVVLQYLIMYDRRQDLAKNDTGSKATPVKKGPELRATLGLLVLQLSDPSTETL